MNTDTNTTMCGAVNCKIELFRLSDPESGHIGQVDIPKPQPVGARAIDKVLCKLI